MGLILLLNWFSVSVYVVEQRGSLYVLGNYCTNKIIF